ncbi:MAG: hypothetical protein LUC31_00410 [Coprobacillus sp.]|nr:hypothetical protein [Coprobacillus sp.]
MKTLVIYYSLSGTTEIVAQRIQTQLDADLFQIVPKKDYGDYHHAIDLAGREYENNELPEYIGDVKDFDSYERIIIGYPLWYYKAPQVVLSFLLSHNLEGKEIYPFCTSGSQDADNSVEVLRSQLPTASIHEGIRVTSYNSSQIEEWLSH